MASLDEAFDRLSARGAFGDKPVAAASPASVFVAQDTNPDEEAALLRLSRRTAIPVESLRLKSNRDEAKRIDATSRYDQALKDNPELDAWMSKNTSNATLAKDDVETLGPISKFVRAFKSGRKSTLRGFDLSAIDESQKVIDTIDELDKGGLTPQMLAQNPYAQTYSGFNREDRARIKQQMLERMVENFAEAKTRAEEIKGLTPSAEFKEIAEAKGWGDTIKKIWKNKGAFFNEGMGQSFGGMSVTAPFAIGGGVVGGARALAAGTFVSSASTEYVTGMAEVLDDMNIPTNDMNAVRAAMRSDEFKNRMQDKAKRAAVVGAFDALGAGVAGVKLGKTKLRNIAAQTGVQATTGGAGEAAGAVVEGKEISPSAVLMEMLMEAPGGAIDVGALATGKALRKMRSANGSIKESEQLTKAMDDASKSLTRGRDKETFQQLVKEVQEGDKHLYLDPVVLSELPNVEALKQSVPSIGAQFDEAINTGRDIRIPLDEALSTIPDTGMVDVLSQHLRSSESSMSAAEAQSEILSGAETIISEARKSVEKSRQRKEIVQDGQVVYDQVLSDLETIGKNTPDVNRRYATLVRAFFETAAARSNKKPTELWEQFRLKVVSGQAKAGEALDQASALDAVRNQWSDAGIEHDISERDGVIALEKIVVPRSERGGGKGTSAMSALIDYADRTGQRIELRASSQMGGDKARLVGFYERMGFKRKPRTGPVGKPFKDTAMFRDPQVLKQSAISPEEAAFFNTQGIEAQAITPEQAQAVADEYGWQSRGEENGFPTWASKYVSIAAPRDVTTGHDIFYKPLAGEKAVKYDILDADGQKVGYTVLEMDGDWPTRLLDIEIQEEHRGKQIAENTVTAIVADVGELGVWSIVPSAESFWRRIGTQIAGTDGTITIDGNTAARASRSNAQGVGRDVSLAQNKDKDRAEYYTSSKTINLLDSDFSSFIHEVGHFYLDVMGEIADSDNAPESIRADMDVLMKWFGISSVAEFNRLKRAPVGSRDSERWRAAQEKFAEGFEQYALEGKAPSLELRDTFARFRSWMLSVYGSMKSFLAGRRINLTDEVRGVMDRMLASKEAIQEAKDAYDFQPSFATQQESGMSDGDWNKYKKLEEQRDYEATAELAARSVRDMQWLDNAKSKMLKEMQRANKEKRKVVMDEVRSEVEQEPVYAAMKAYAEGDEKISAASVEELFSGDGDRFALLDWSPLSKGGKRRIVSKEGAVSIDEAAVQYGFPSGEQMVREMLSAPPINEVINARTDEEMLRRYGDITSPQAMNAAADQALHSRTHLRFLTTELAAMDASFGTPGFVGRAIKLLAAEMLSKERVGSLNPLEFTRAAARAGKRAMAEWKQGNRDQAADFKRMQAIQSRAALDAFATQDEITSGLRYLNKFDKKSVRQNLRGEYVDQIDAIRARFDLRKSSKPAGQTLDDFVFSQIVSNGVVAPDLHQIVADEGFRANYKDLTIEQFRGLVDSIKQLEHMARSEQRMFMAKRNMDFAQERDAVLARLQEFSPEAFNEDGEPKPVVSSDTPSIGKTLRKIKHGAAKAALSVETVANILEGGDVGQLHESFVSRLSERSDFKATKLREIGDKLKPFFQAFSVKETFDFGRKDITADIAGQLKTDFHDGHLTRENVVMIAMLYGNAEGRERLKNYGWNDYQIGLMLDRLNAKDIDLINTIVDVFDNDLWPELESLNKRTTGSAPPKVLPIPHKAKNGELRGGYMRLMYRTDTGDQRAQDVSLEQAVSDMLGGGSRTARTAQGTSKERVQGVTMRPRIDFGVVSQALTETVHDIAYREAVADTYRLVTNQKIATALTNIVGEAGLNAVKNWVRDIAKRPQEPIGAMEVAASIARRNTTVAMLSGVSTALQNITGIFPAMSRLSPSAIAHTLSVMVNPFGAAKSASDASEFMANRMTSYDRDANQQIKQMTVAGKVIPSTAKMLAIMGYVDRYMATAVWHGALKDGMKKFDGDEAKAIEYADHVVRQTQGSGRDVDAPEVMRGTEFRKLFTMYYSYMNAQANQLVRAKVVTAREFKENKPLAIAKGSARIMALYLAPALLSLAIKESMSNKGDDKEPEDKAAQALAMYLTGMVPGVRDISSYAWRKYYDSAYVPSLTITPIESSLKTVADVPESVADIYGGEGNDRDLNTLIMGASYVAGLPGRLLIDAKDAWNRLTRDE